jgi:hypothetical protein
MYGDATRHADVTQHSANINTGCRQLTCNKQSKRPLVQPVLLMVQLDRSGIELETGKIQTVSISSHTQISHK